MLLFVGLGNPTPDSENNRHNIGFKMIDAINQKFQLSKQKSTWQATGKRGNAWETFVFYYSHADDMDQSPFLLQEMCRIYM